MRFYDRKEELRELHQTREIAFRNHSQMTAVMGRRRIGKTKLVMKSCEGSDVVYLFVSQNTETILCREFTESAKEALGEFIPSGIESFKELFEAIMAIGRRRKFTLFIDEFQEFYKINKSIYSGIQEVWDRYKDITNVNFIAAGSMQTMMHKVFMEYGEPLYGRCDSILTIKPFTPSVLKEIMRDYHPHYSNDDLLALYTITGGVPKYIELLVDRGKLTVDEIIDYVIRPNSIFLDEGNILLVQEFGKEYGKYYSILGAIAQGRNSSSEISQITGIESLGGLLEKLEIDYELVKKQRPVFAKPRSQTIRYGIYDNFLRFWFRYIVKYQGYIQNDMTEKLAELVKNDYPTYSGITLEMYFREKLKEEKKYSIIGSWWETARQKSDNQNEIDIVAVTPDEKEALVAEVKRNRKNFKPRDFERKVEILRTKHLASAKLETICLSMEDM